MATENGSITFQKEKFKDFIDDGMPLIKEHIDEVYHWKHEEDLKVQTYGMLCEGGLMRLYTARKSNSELVGYASFFVEESIHYKGLFQAKQDAIFIVKGERGFGTAFIKWCDEQLKKEGISAVYHSVKTDHDFSKALTSQGYKLVEYVYAKEL